MFIVHNHFISSPCIIIFVDARVYACAHASLYMCLIIQLHFGLLKWKHCLKITSVLMCVLCLIDDHIWASERLKNCLKNLRLNELLGICFVPTSNVKRQTFRQHVQYTRWSIRQRIVHSIRKFCFVCIANKWMYKVRYLILSYELRLSL